MSHAPRQLALVALAAFCTFAPSCGGQQLVSLMPGVINDPQNRTLRRSLLKFGGDQFCREMTQRNAPLRLRDTDPVMGRFFPRQCDYHELENGDVFLQFSGPGYAFLQPGGRVGFVASGAIQYNDDFLVDGSTMYAYFRPRNVQSTDFKAQMVEKVDQSGLGQLLSPTVKNLADRIGAQMVNAELARGFTVVRQPDGTADFGLGIVDKGSQPAHPFQVRGSDKATLANERTELHPEQRDFLGPFEVDGSGRALYVTMALDGTPAVDVFVYRRSDAEPWLTEYATRAQLTPAPPGSPLMTDVVAAHSPWQRALPLTKGFYFLVIDNSSVAGRVAPPGAPGGLLGQNDVTAVVDYVVQLGDAP